MTVNNGCGHYFEVCCKEMKPSNVTEVPVPPEEPKPDHSSSILKNWTHTTCGKRNENGIGFKISGNTGGESEFGEFPWTVAVAEEEFVEQEGPNGSKITVTRNSLLCGGSLIHPQVVLTAAHCVYEIAYSDRYKHLKVRAGEWDTQTTDEPYPYQDRYVKEVVVHRELYLKRLYNDIALLILDKEVKLAPNVDTICLPSPSMHESDFVGESCFSSGWGKNEFGAEGRYQEIMKKTQVPVVSKNDCQEALRKTRLGNFFILHSSFLCAGGQPGKDTCVGDGGSPLVCKAANSQSYVQVGIVDWGIGCNSAAPGVYVNAIQFVPWILEKLRKRNFSTKFCTLEI